MRILIAVDRHSYSENIVPVVGRLIANTWADVTLVGVQARNDAPEKEWVDALFKYQKTILSHFGNEEMPYELASPSDMNQAGKGLWEVTTRGLKRFSIRLRSGDASKEILAQAREDKSDLIVIGCTKGLDCEWEGEVRLPQKIAKEAACSVLVIKEQKQPNQISSFLDQTNVSQESLELINQLVTLYDAGLKIIGLKDEKGTIGKEDVEKKMLEVLKYYNEKKISAWIKMVEIDNLEEYVAGAAAEGIVAIWVGKKSLISRIFSRDLVGKLVSQAQTSVLVLR